MDNKILEQVAHIAKKYPEIHMLMLFGSRARGTERADSDWDFGYIADKNFDSDPLYADLVIFLKTEKVDLVNLSRANALLRFRATEDGKLILENKKGAYFRFLFEAIDFWCDAGPLIQKGYEDILGALK